MQQQTPGQDAKYTQSQKDIRQHQLSSLFNWRYLVREIYTKMLWAIQVAGFLKQIFFQNKWMKYPYFLHFDTNAKKFKVDQNIFVLTWVWMQPVFKTLKLTVSKEWKDEIN